MKRRRLPSNVTFWQLYFISRAPQSMDLQKKPSTQSQSPVTLLAAAEPSIFPALVTDNEIKKRSNLLLITKSSKLERLLTVISLAEIWLAINKNVISFRLKVLIATNP